MGFNPKISIVVPVYNNEAYLEKCVDSLLGQTYKNLEIILINDGSTDGCLDIMNGYKGKDERIVVIDKENEGLSATRNVGIEIATGDYIMFVDSDDWIDLDCCSDVLDEIARSKADVVMWSYIREFDDKSTPKRIFDTPRVEFDDVINTMYVRQLGLVGSELKNPEDLESLNSACTKLYNLDIIKCNNIRFVDTKLIGTEDALFNLYVYSFASKVVYLNKYYYHYLRSNVGTLTKSYKDDLYDKWQKLFSMMKEDANKNNPSERAYLALKNRIALSIIGLGLNVIRSDKSMINKVGEIKSIISSSAYKDAYKSLIIEYFPLHWKVFFLCAKMNFAFGVFVLTNIIKRIIEG